MHLKPHTANRIFHVTYSRPWSLMGFLKSILSVLAIITGLSSAQEYGSHTLPADLADSTAKVLGALNKDPNNANRTLGYSEGPATDMDGNLFFTEGQDNTGNIFKVTLDGKESVFFSGPTQPNGMEFDPQGRLTVCEKGSVSTFDKAGVRTQLSNPGNVDLKNVNDLSIASDGSMWLTNHGTGNTYFYRDPSGVITTYPNTNALGVLVPNGIEYLEEKKLLFVNSSDDNKVYLFDVSAAHKPSNKRVFASVPVPDGLTVDEKGNVYIASFNDGAIYVFDPTGNQLLGKIKVTGDANPVANTSNCVFGGIDGKTLYMTGDAGAFKLQMKVAGRKRPGSVGLHAGRSQLFHRGPNTWKTRTTLLGRSISQRLPVATLAVFESPSR